MKSKSEAYEYILKNAKEAADILNKNGLKQLIADYLDNFNFEQRCF